MPELVELVAKLDLEAHQFCKPPITDLYFSIHKGYSTLPVDGILADSLAAGVALRVMPVPIRDRARCGLASCNKICRAVRSAHAAHVLRFEELLRALIACPGRESTLRLHAGDIWFSICVIPLLPPG